MLTEPVCFTRKCKNFIGSSNNEEKDQKIICKAFKNEIPDEIAYGSNLHAQPLKEQKNNIVFEEQ